MHPPINQRLRGSRRKTELERFCIRSNCFCPGFLFGSTSPRALGPSMRPPRHHDRVSFDRVDVYPLALRWRGCSRFLPEPAFNGWLREAFLLIDIAVMAELPVKSVLFGNIPALELSRPMSRQPGRYFCGLKVSAKFCGLGCDAGPRRKSGRTFQEKRLQSGRTAARLLRYGVASGVTPKIGCPPTETPRREWDNGRSGRGRRGAAPHR